MRVALRGIMANRMRSALTMLGILIGTAAVILLVAVGTGISNQVQVQIKNLGTNAIYILPERNSGGQNRGGTNARRIRLTKADVKALSDKTRAPSLDLVAPTVGSSGTVTWNGTTYALQNFIGGSPEFGDIRNTPVEKGRFLTQEDIASHAKRVVILEDGRICDDYRNAPVEGEPPGLIDLTAMEETTEVSVAEEGSTSEVVVP